MAICNAAHAKTKESTHPFGLAREVFWLKKGSVCWHILKSVGIGRSCFIALFPLVAKAAYFGRVRRSRSDLSELPEPPAGSMTGGGGGVMSRRIGVDDRNAGGAAAAAGAAYARVIAAGIPAGRRGGCCCGACW